MSTEPIEGALHGLRVLDVTQMLAGPIASMRLGDLGADVIKIEPPGTGEFNRSHGYAGLTIAGHTTTFMALNRNKRSVALNLKSAAAREVFYRLVESADVLVHNFRLGTPERLGIDYATLSALNPRLVYCTISGYGADGPGAGRPGQDLVLQGYSGSMRLVGSRSDPPTPGGIPAIDVMTGYQAVAAILAAIIARDRIGTGQHVQVDMLAVVLDAQIQELFTYLNTGAVPTRREEWSAHVWVPAPYGVYRTSDGWLTMAMCSLSLLGRALDCDRLQQFDRYEDGFDHADEVYAIVRPRLRERSTSEWMSHFDQYNIWTGPVYEYPDLENDEQVRARNLIVTTQHPELGELRTVAPPLQLSANPPSIRRSSPLLGQHTADVLAELGLDHAQIAALAESDAVGLAAEAASAPGTGVLK
jgi:crotonobetainyl-CoA:carnitine CoA-transferase CaiB-like acyl-CoA transferase